MAFHQKHTESIIYNTFISSVLLPNKSIITLEKVRADLKKNFNKFVMITFQIFCSQVVTYR